MEPEAHCWVQKQGKKGQNSVEAYTPDSPLNGQSTQCRLNFFLWDHYSTPVIPNLLGLLSRFQREKKSYCALPPWKFKGIESTPLNCTPIAPIPPTLNHSCSRQRLGGTAHFGKYCSVPSNVRWLLCQGLWGPLGQVQWNLQTIWHLWIALCFVGRNRKLEPQS